MGTIDIRIQVPGERVMLFKVDVVSANVPFLIGLDVLHKFKLVVDTVEN